MLSRAAAGTSSSCSSRDSMAVVIRRALQQSQASLSPCCSTPVELLDLKRRPAPGSELQPAEAIGLALGLLPRKRLVGDLGDYRHRHRQRLNWNPLGLTCGPARQLSVRYNTQTAQTPPTTPPTPPNALLVPNCTVPATSNARRAFLVDTLAVMRRLEAQQLSPRQAEAITAVVTTVLNDSLESVAQSYTSKADMQKCEMMQDATLSKFKAEMQSSLEHHFSTLQRESERLRTDMEKMRSELRYEIDKVQANQRLDLNLERGHIRDELNKQQSETSNLTNKLDREIHTLKTQLEAAKYDVIKYCIGTIVSVTAVGLGLLRIIM